MLKIQLRAKETRRVFESKLLQRIVLCWCYALGLFFWIDLEKRKLCICSPPPQVDTKRMYSYHSYIADALESWAVPFQDRPETRPHVRILVVSIQSKEVRSSSGNSEMRGIQTSVELKSADREVGPSEAVILCCERMAVPPSLVAAVCPPHRMKWDFASSHWTTR